MNFRGLRNIEAGFIIPVWFVPGLLSRKSRHPTPTPGNFDYPTPTPTPGRLRPSAVLAT